MRRNVLHIIYSLYRGGAERIIDTIIRISPRDRYEHGACSLTGAGDLVESMQAAGARVFILHKRRGADPLILQRIARLLRRERINILHLHNASATLYGTLAVMLNRIGIPVVRTEHGAFIPGNLPALYRRLYPMLTRRTSRVICVAESLREDQASRFPRLADRYVTIPNGTETEAFASLPPRAECRARFKLPPSGRILGTIGRLVPVKNHLSLVEALCILRRTVPDVHLAILGTGDLREQIVRRAADLGINDIVSIVPTTEDVPAFLGALDAFVLSSDSEGLPLTLLEALAAGLPAVATRVGGIPEVIEDGSNGLLVPPGSPRELAAGLAALMADPAAASAMGARGREMVRGRFDARTMVARIEKLYDGL